MKNDELFDKIGEIDDDLIERADRTAKKSSRPWWSYAAIIAACLIIIVSAGPQILSRMKTESSVGEITNDSSITAKSENGDKFKPEVVDKENTPEAEPESSLILRSLDELRAFVNTADGETATESIGKAAATGIISRPITVPEGEFASLTYNITTGSLLCVYSTEIGNVYVTTEADGTETLRVFVDGAMRLLADGEIALRTSTLAEIAK